MIPVFEQAKIFYALDRAAIVIGILLVLLLLLFELLPGVSENFFCSMSAVQVRIVLLPDAHLLLILFAETLAYLEPKVLLLIIHIL
jgi:hypothetical protein